MVVFHSFLDPPTRVPFSSSSRGGSPMDSPFGLPKSVNGCFIIWIYCPICLKVICEVRKIDGRVACLIIILLSPHTYTHTEREEMKKKKKNKAVLAVGGGGGETSAARLGRRRRVAMGINQCCP